MKTMERNTTYESPEKAPVRAATRRRWWLFAAVAVLALAAGFVVGRWTAASDESAAHLAGGGALSDRQEQMLNVLDKAVLGWRAGDPEAVSATFVPTGYATYAGRSYRVDDGTLATFVTGGDWSSLTVLQPVLVDGNTLTFYYEISDVHYLGSVEFTRTGDVLAVHQGIDL